MKYEDYWSPGTKHFISITSTRSRPIDSITSTRCQIVRSWDEAFDIAKRFLEGNRFSADTITIFTKPRLCKKCMEHATQLMIFDYAEHIEECLCKLLKTPCGVHGIAQTEDVSPSQKGAEC